MGGPLNNASLPQSLDQSSPGAMDPSLDGTQRYSHGLGDLVVTQLMFMKQNKRLAILVANAYQS